MKINENQWKLIKIHGNHYKSMKIQWNSLNIIKNQMFSIKINKNQIKANGNQWTPMKGVGGMGGALIQVHNKFFSFLHDPSMRRSQLHELALRISPLASCCSASSVNSSSVWVSDCCASRGNFSSVNSESSSGRTELKKKRSIYNIKSIHFELFLLLPGLPPGWPRTE